MTVKVFVLGRPGSGKSTAVHYMLDVAGREGWLPLRFKDYDSLYKMFEDDTEGKRFRPAACGGFDILDFSVLDTALEELEKAVRREVQKQEEDIAYASQQPVLPLIKNIFVTIEFARDDYSQALQKFSPDFLKDAYVLFLDADINICIERVHRRVTFPPTPDNHFVSDEIIKSYYSKDNWDYMTSHLARVRAIHNTSSLQDFQTQVDEFLNFIFAQEANKQLQVGDAQASYNQQETEEVAA